MKTYLDDIAAANRKHVASHTLVAVGGLAAAALSLYRISQARVRLALVEATKQDIKMMNKIT